VGEVGALVWVVLCEPFDAAAVWVYQGLAERLAPVRLLTSEQLLSGARFEQRIGRRCSVELELPGGEIIGSQTVTGGLNRLQGMTPRFLRRFVPEDTQYVWQECYSALVGWLYALTGNLLNPPQPMGLSGRWRPFSEWVWLAGRAGLPVASHGESVPRERAAAVIDDGGAQSGGAAPQDGTRSALVVRGKVWLGAELPRGLESGCRRLAAVADTPLLGIDFALVSDRWRFSGATPAPELRWGGDALLDLIGETLMVHRR
jgi:hypothetical protein